MTPTRFRKRPVEIEAVQLTHENLTDVFMWLGRQATMILRSYNGRKRPGLAISTLEGVMKASPGDWIIKGVAGEFYPCRDDIFRKTYEAVEP